MNKVIKTLLKILNGRNDSNIEFADMIHLLTFLKFEERIKGSHHIFSKSGIIEIINLQSSSTNKCKNYQVKQVRNLIVKYKLGELADE